MFPRYLRLANEWETYTLKEALGLQGVLGEDKAARSGPKFFAKIFVSEMRYALTRDNLSLFPKSDFLKLWQVAPAQIPVRKLICYRLPPNQETKGIMEIIFKTEEGFEPQVSSYWKVLLDKEKAAIRLPLENEQALALAKALDGLGVSQCKEKV